MGHQTPDPMPTYADMTIFRPDGQLKEPFQDICSALHLNPEELRPKTVDAFKQKNASYNIQILRYNHYEGKRQGMYMTLAFSKQLLLQYFSKGPGLTSDLRRKLCFQDSAV